MTATAAHPSDLDTVPSFISPSGRREVAAVRTAPVSYTHLDVYKRQVLGQLAAIAQRHRPAGEVGELGAESGVDVI